MPVKPSSRTRAKLATGGPSDIRRLAMRERSLVISQDTIGSAETTASDLRPLFGPSAIDGNPSMATTGGSPKRAVIRYTPAP